jgi:hypothetical protein
LNKKSVSPHGDPIVGSNFALNNPTAFGSIDAGEINPRLILQRSDVMSQPSPAVLESRFFGWFLPASNSPSGSSLRASLVKKYSVAY